MKTIHDFQNMARQGRQDTPPLVEVSDQVLAQIRQEWTEDWPASNWLLYSFSALAGIAAVMVSIISLNLYQQATDPFVGFLVDITRIMQ